MRFSKILCPIDFSEASYRGLAKAIELTTPLTTEICVVHVEPPFDIARNIREGALNAADRRAETIKKLFSVMEERIPSTLKARPLLCRGDATVEIVKAAREEKADLLVLTTHGAGRGNPGDLGEVAAKVLRMAPCRVLTLNSCGHSDLPTPAPAQTLCNSVKKEG